MHELVLKIIKIPKSKNKYRKIIVPTNKGKLLCNKYKEYFDLYYYIMSIYASTNNFVFGFINNRGPIDNAIQHKEHQFTISMDLQDFFNSVRPEDIQPYFKDKYIGNISLENYKKNFIQGKFNINNNKLILKYIKFLKQHSMGIQYEFIKENFFVDNELPQGFSTSPTLSNFAFLKYDIMIRDLLFVFNNTTLKSKKQSIKISNHKDIEKDLESINVKPKKGNIVYTRYVDDITFSSNNEELLKIFLKYFGQLNIHFKFNKHKEKFVNGAKENRIITGVSIDANGKLNPTRKLKRKIRAANYQQNEKSLKGLENWSTYIKLKENKPNDFKITSVNHFINNLKNFKLWDKIFKGHSEEKLDNTITMNSTSDIKYIKEKNNEIMQIIKKTNETIEPIKEETNQNFEELGKLKTDIYITTLEKFNEHIKVIKNILFHDDTTSPSLHSSYQFSQKDLSVLEAKIVSTKHLLQNASEENSAVTVSLSTIYSAVAAFGLDSTKKGTSSTSDIFSNNNTLTWLGGKVFTIVGITIDPSISHLLWKGKLNYANTREEVDENHILALTYNKKMNNIIKNFQELNKEIINISVLINKYNIECIKLNRQTDNIKYNIGINYKKFSDTQKALIQKHITFISQLLLLLNTPIINKDGSFNNQLIETLKASNTFFTKQGEHKLIDFKKKKSIWYFILPIISLIGIAGYLYYADLHNLN